MTSLRDRLLKATTLEYADTLEDSKVFNNRDVATTPIPILNVAYGAAIDSGLGSGLTVWAGPSKHFKTLFCLISAASYLKQHDDSVVLFYDSEFGSPKGYFTAAGIDPSRVIHCPVTSLEDLRTDLANQLKEIKRGDKVVIVVDSMGNLASNKEIKDAEDGSEKADMTRAKVGKSLFRIVTPHLRLKDIPMLVVAHTYDTMEMYSKKVVSGGTGIYYAADNLYIVGRQQEKDSQKDLIGFNFTINVEKSRFTKEKSQLNVTVLREGGVMKWSGLFDIALEAGMIIKVNKSNYSVVDPTTGEIDDKTFSRSEVENDGKFWRDAFKRGKLAETITSMYAVADGELISEETDATEVSTDD